MTGLPIAPKRLATTGTATVHPEPSVDGPTGWSR